MSEQACAASMNYTSNGAEIAKVEVPSTAEPCEHAKADHEINGRNHRFTVIGHDDNTSVGGVVDVCIAIAGDVRFRRQCRPMCHRDASSLQPLMHRR